MYFKREKKYLVTEKKSKLCIQPAVKNVDLYKSTPLNSKTEQTFQQAHQDRGIYQVCGECNCAKMDTQKGHVSHSDTA